MFVMFVTNKARDFLIKKKEQYSIYILDIKDSGCSGYKYKFYQSKEIAPNRHFNGIDFFVDKSNEKFLNNIIIDLKKEGINEKIYFDNPNAAHECGCGESFGIKKGV